MSKSSKKTKQAKEVDSKPLRASDAPAAKTKIVGVQKRNNKTGKNKRAQLIELLSNKSGAAIDIVVKSLKWKPHSGRAAISNLRKAGYRVETGADKDGKTVYRILGVGKNAAAGKTMRVRS